MQAIIGSLLRELLKKLTPDLVKEIIDVVLDKVEDKIKATEGTWDDAFILPLIDTIRTVAGIKDENYGTDKEENVND